MTENQEDHPVIETSAVPPDAQPQDDDNPAESGGPAPQPTPASAEEIPQLRQEIDAIDAEILRLVQRRSEISHRVGLARMAAGGPRMVYGREMEILARFRALGPEGRELAMLLLRLGRGRLGRA